MEFFYGNSNDSQASKVQSLDVSPINSQNFTGRGRYYPGPKNRILDPFASSDSSGSSSNRVLSPIYLHSRSPVSFASDSPERRSLVNTSSGSRSGSGGAAVFRSPLASIDNIEIPTSFRTPVKVEEDVVVMDGILVEPKHGARAKSSPSTSDSGGRLSSSTSGSENSSHKSEVCRWWGDTGTCRFGSKCRFVHGKEDLRPTAFANRNHSEAPSSRSYSSGSRAYGPRGRSGHHQVHSAASSTESAAMATPTIVKRSCLLKTKSPQAATVAPVPPPPQLLSLALTGVPWMIISRFLCLLLVKNVLPGKMLMLIYGLFSMVFLEGRDCRYLLNFLRSSCAMFPSLSFYHQLPIRQLHMDDTFQPPFKSCVLEGNVASVMCSYNQVNGKPTCGDPDLLAEIIRGEWNLNGYIVTDCDSLNEIFNSQHYTKTPEETAALGLNSGVDLNCGSWLSKYTQGAVNQKLVNESVIDRAISNNFATLMRLGFFDGNPRNHIYGNLGPKDVCTPENQELAREAARQGIVLLKNAAGSLPLTPTAIKSLAVIGPNANVTKTMIGNYEGTPCKYTTPLQGLTTSVATIYKPGCSDVSCNTAQLDDAKKIASTADAVVMVMGSDQSIERESLDRVNITLPGQQSVLIAEVAKVAKGPVILVIMSGGGMDVQFAVDNPKITSILWVGFPGEAGGAALADVLFGYYNPSGRLPMTWYPQSYADAVPMTIMNMRPDPATNYPGRTYRFYTGPTVFTFGHGLSYSQFKHRLDQAPTFVSIPLEEKHTCRSTKCKSIDTVEQSCSNLGFNVHLRVKNMGKISGSHTIFLFNSPPSVHNAPQKHLLGFEKVHLTPQEEGVVKFNVDVCKHLSLHDELGNKKVALGQHVLHIGHLKHSFTVRI